MMYTIKETILTVAVLAVVVILCVGAASPAYRDKDLRCRSNLQKIYQLTCQYESDYGRTPPPVVPKRPVFYDSFLRKYTNDKLIFACPSDARNAYMYEEETPLFPAPPQCVASYGMNFYFTDAMAARAGIDPPALKKVRDPRRMVVYGDCLIPYMKMMWFWDETKAFAPRHQRRGWFVFADGSTELLSKTEFGTTLERWKW